MRLRPSQHALLLSVLLHGAALAGLARVGGAALPVLTPPDEPMVVWLHDHHEAPTALSEAATVAPVPAIIPKHPAAPPQKPQQVKPSTGDPVAEPATPPATPADITFASPSPSAAPATTSAPSAAAERDIAMTAPAAVMQAASGGTPVRAVADAPSAMAPGSGSLGVGTQADHMARPDHGRNPPPVYPRLLREQGIEGTVLVRASVGPDGMAQSVELAASSGHRLLDQAALRAVQRWHFIPARLNDTPVASTVEFPISFRLTGSEPGVDPRSEPVHQANAGA